MRLRPIACTVAMLFLALSAMPDMPAPFGAGPFATGTAMAATEQSTPPPSEGRRQCDHEKEAPTS